MDDWEDLRWGDAPRTVWGPTLAQHGGVWGSPAPWLAHGAGFTPLGAAGSQGRGKGEMWGGLGGAQRYSTQQGMRGSGAPHGLWQGN